MTTNRKVVGKILSLGIEMQNGDTVPLQARLSEALFGRHLSLNYNVPEEQYIYSTMQQENKSVGFGFKLESYLTNGNHN